MHFTEATDFQKDCYTRVLLGHLDVERAIWPDGVYHGADIDFLARRHLFNAGLEYKHGTGHGVGTCLCVHESLGQIGIARHFKVPFKAGMCVSNEPGFY